MGGGRIPPRQSADSYVPILAYFLWLFWKYSFCIMHVWVEGLLCEKILQKNARQVRFLGGGGFRPPPIRNKLHFNFSL